MLTALTSLSTLGNLALKAQGVKTSRHCRVFSCCWSSLCLSGVTYQVWLAFLSGKALVLLRDSAEVSASTRYTLAAGHARLVSVGKGEVWGPGIRVEAC